MFVTLNYVTRFDYLYIRYQTLILLLNQVQWRIFFKAHTYKTIKKHIDKSLNNIALVCFDRMQAACIHSRESELKRLSVLHTFLFLKFRRRKDYRLGKVLCLQLSELLADSSLILITFFPLTLQLADVATNFCHILNLYTAFLARVWFQSESYSDTSIRGEAFWALVCRNKLRPALDRNRCCLSLVLSDSLASSRPQSLWVTLAVTLLSLLIYIGLIFH